MSLTSKPLITLGSPFIELLQVDSTNNYALNLIKKGSATNGTTVFSHYQTQGRGQMNKTWQSPTNENILMSVVVDISSIQLQNQFPVFAFATLGCIDLLKNVNVPNYAIKWSNDIFIKDKKTGGILIETCHYNEKRFAIIGIGLNVNQKVFGNNLHFATSLSVETEQTFDSIFLAKKLLEYLSIWYNEMINHGFSKIHNTYNQHLYKKGSSITLKKNNIKFNCTPKQVNEFGELEVENCIYEKFSFGEVIWVLE